MCQFLFLFMKNKTDFFVCLFLKKKTSWVAMAHTFNPSIQEAEMNRFL